ncbi:hypothetical protein BU17DRAFT_68290 [Hysterangium stoloniferum]|nr:hypothetical protein BU17DRAFT_68290 [Hysterangium stoloniferum]
MPLQLPTELVLEIVSHLVGIYGDIYHDMEAQIKRVFLTIARRTLENDRELASVVKSLTLPADDKLHFRTMISTKLTARRGRAIRQLVAQCPNLTHLAIPMESALWWDASTIQKNFPSMAYVTNVTHLEISGSKGPWVYPPPKRIIGFQHLAAWLGQIPLLPNLECLTLTEIVMSRTEGAIVWPEMPRLRHMRLNDPFWTTTFDDRLFLHVQRSLNSLHIFDTYQPYLERSSTFRPFSDQSYTATRLLPYLEAFTLVYNLNGTGIPSMNWLMTDVGQHASLRWLRISGFLVREKLLTYSRSPLETLVLVTICGEILPNTVKNVTIEVEPPKILSEEACLEHMIVASRLKAERLGIHLRVDRRPKPDVKLELTKLSWATKHLSLLTKDTVIDNLRKIYHSPSSLEMAWMLVRSYVPETHNQHYNPHLSIAPCDVFPDYAKVMWRLERELAGYSSEEGEGMPPWVEDFSAEDSEDDHMSHEHQPPLPPPIFGAPILVLILEGVRAQNQVVPAKLQERPERP